MIRRKTGLIPSTVLTVLLLSITSAHAWSFLTDSLNSPYNQCLTCHTSNSDVSMNPYGNDYLDPNHADRYHQKHNSDPGICANCHSGKGYPIKQTGLDDLDSDGDGYTNLDEFLAGSFPGDPGDVPPDITAPVITDFTLPSTSLSLSVIITSLTATDNVAVTGYRVSESNATPTPEDAAWSDAAPSSYTFETADIHTLYAWAKDAAGNISAAGSAQVDTTPSLVHVNEPPVASAGNDIVTTEGLTVILDANGSTDDSGIAAYAWTQLDGPGGAPIDGSDANAVTLSDSGGINPTFVTPAVDVNGTNLTFELSVEDSDGARSTGEVTVTIEDNGIVDFDGMPGVISSTTLDGDPIGFSAGSGGAFTFLDTLMLQDIPATSDEPQGVMYGLVEFELKVGDTAGSNVTIYFPEAIPEGYSWYKYTENTGWLDFDRNLISGGTGEGAEFNSDRTQVTVYVNDNGSYDDDPAVGIVRDPGGLGRNPAGLGTGDTPPDSTAQAIINGPDGNAFGGDFPGCFIGGVSRAGHSGWVLMIFPGILIVTRGISAVLRRIA